MFENLPLFQSIRRLLSKKQRIHPNPLPTFYDLYNEQYQRPWEIQINLLDKTKIQYAIDHQTNVYLNPNLSDVQLLKLHAPSFPEYDNQLIYHKMFDLYEVKYKKKTVAIFSYRSGIYSPVNGI